jgi:hypothetical protein
LGTVTLQPARAKAVASVMATRYRGMVLGDGWESVAVGMGSPLGDVGDVESRRVDRLFAITS